MAKTERFATRGGGFLIEEVVPDEVFTPEEFTEEQKMIAEMSADFLEREVRPHVEEIEQQNWDLSLQLMRKAGELGLLGAEVPEEYGGLGLDKISATLIGENLSPGGGFALTHGAHVGIGSLPIVFFGNDDQRRRYLPDLATGKKIAAYALTEPGSGSDALGAKTRADLSEDGRYYILNGQKQWITNSAMADVFTVYAKVDGEKFTAFIVDRETEGFSIGPEEKKMGIKGSSTRPLYFENARVPVENVLGEIGRGHVIAFNILNIGRFKLGAGCLGSSKRLIETAAKYASERQQFGRPLASFPLIQSKLAEMQTRTFILDSVNYRTAGLIDRNLARLESEAAQGEGGDDAGRRVAAAIAEYAVEASINKVLGSETLDFVVDEAVQIHGGYGYMQEYEVERAYRDSRINRIFEGTNEINRLLMPGQLLRRAMKGELPLLQVVQRLQSEILGLTPPLNPEGPLGEAKWLVEAMKKSTLMVAGLAVQKFQQKIEEEQEILAALADMLMATYAFESGLLRAEKSLAAGKDSADLQVAMVRLYGEEAATQVENLARTALAAFEEGDTLRTQLSVIKKLFRRTPLNTVALQRQIAAAVLDRPGYVA